MDTNPGTRATCAYKETMPTRGQAAERKDGGKDSEHGCLFCVMVVTGMWNGMME